MEEVNIQFVRWCDMYSRRNSYSCFINYVTSLRNQVWIYRFKHNKLMKSNEVHKLDEIAIIFLFFGFFEHLIHWWSNLNNNPIYFTFVFDEFSVFHWIKLILLLTTKFIDQNSESRQSHFIQYKYHIRAIVHSLLLK